MPTHTPWGWSQYRETYFKGCTFFGTASHGGLHVSPSAYKYLSEYTLKAGYSDGTHKGLWYEEDCGYLLPIYEFFKYPKLRDKLKDRFKEPTIEQIKQWFDDYEDTPCERQE